MLQRAYNNRRARPFSLISRKEEAEDDPGWGRSRRSFLGTAQDPLSVEYHVIYIGFISCCPLHQFSPSIHNYRNTDLALIELNILSLMAL